jgi:hypothetical protein
MAGRAVQNGAVVEACACATIAVRQPEFRGDENVRESRLLTNRLAFDFQLGVEWVRWLVLDEMSGAFFRPCKFCWLSGGKILRSRLSFRMVPSWQKGCKGGMRRQNGRILNSKNQQ